MKKLAMILLLGIFLLSINCCIQPVAIRNIILNQPGHIQFGKVKERVFTENKSISELIQLKWIFETGGSQLNSSVIIYDKYLFVTDLSGKFYVLDKETGNLIGMEKFSGAIQAAPVIVNLRVFLAVNDKEEKYSSLIYFDLLEGKILNEDRIEGSVISEMIKLDNGLTVVSSKGEVIKYNFVGARIWSCNSGVATKSSPASDGKTILFGNEKGEVVSVDIDTGKIVFRKKYDAAIESGFTIDNGSVYFGDNNGNIYSVQAADGKINWKFGTGEKITSIPVFNNSKIFSGNLGGDLFCLDKTNGTLIWKTKTNGLINTTPFLFQNYLIQPNINKEVDLVNVSSGKIENRLTFDTRPKLSPVYYQKFLYLGIDKGIINAYQVFENK